jgi:type IV secretory pathway protease TraF
MSMNCKNGPSTAAAIRHQSTDLLSRFQISVLGASALGLAFLAVKPLAGPSPLIIWNASESVPIGWYFVSKRQPENGEIAALKPTGWIKLFASERKYLPMNVWLLKPIAATEPSIICRFGHYVFVDGKLAARAQTNDKMGRQMPVWKGCKRLGKSDLFLLSHHSDSFDSRYFGPIDRDQVIGTASLLADLLK